MLSIPMALSIPIDVYLYRRRLFELLASLMKRTGNYKYFHPKLMAAL